MIGRLSGSNYKSRGIIFSGIPPKVGGIKKL